MKKSLLLLASVACLGMFAVGCEGDDTDPCENMTCDVGQECTTTDYGFFGKLAACTATEETCKALNAEKEGAQYQLQIHPIKGKICVDQSAQGGSGTTDDGLCYKNADCEEAAGEQCDTTTGYCEIPAQDNEYRYVRIDDLSPKTSDGEDPGADIDAVVIQKASNGSKFYATDVIAYAHGDGGSTKAEDLEHAYNPKAALGAPDSIVDYTFVSLGGEGGHIVLEMGAAIENGDKMYVTETGDCKLVKDTTRSGKGGNAKAEQFKVSLAASKEAADGDWKVIIDGSSAQKGVVSATVAGL